MGLTSHVVTDVRFIVYVRRYLLRGYEVTYVDPRLGGVATLYVGVRASPDGEGSDPDACPERWDTLSFGEGDIAFTKNRGGVTFSLEWLDEDYGDDPAYGFTTIFFTKLELR
jgi:hypothetical protein